MKSDAELLRSYVRDRSEEAFAELVRRHLASVYSGALRRVGGDTHLAEDVSQQVFSDLARKAPTLIGRPSFSGWLYVSTHWAAAEVVRKEQRRKARETEAHTMEKILSSAAPEPAADWSRLRPVLDELILELKDDDREALALRFFGQRSFAEIGAALRLTEDAARKRVERSVEKLRRRLIDRGVTSTAGAVAFALGEATVSAAPAGLAAQITGVAVAQATLAGAGTSLFISILNVLTSKAVTGGAVVLAILAGLFWQHRTQAELRAEIASFGGQREMIRALREENERLARAAEQADELRRAVAALPPPEPPPAPPLPPSPPAYVPQANIVVTDRGGILWEGEPITLDQFTSRMRTFHSLNPGPEAKVSLVVQPGGNFGQLSYVTDEARRAGIKDVVAESSAKPGPGSDWFSPTFVQPRPPRTPRSP